MTEKEIINQQITEHQDAIDNAKAELAKLNKPKAVYAIGDRFYNNYDSEKYILCATSGGGSYNTALVSLETGHSSGAQVSNWNRITEEELKKFSNSCRRYWDNAKQEEY